ncbi:hypothetical protein M8C21_002396, partial [Ambrosia artemisiifolia]
KILHDPLIRKIHTYDDYDPYVYALSTGSFEKCLQVTMILSLAGEQFSQKVAENSVAFWKTNGTYTNADDKIINKFLEVFKGQKLPPGSSILLTVSPVGSLMISLSKDGIIPEAANIVLEIEKLGEAMTEMIIGKHGVSPEVKTKFGIKTL